LQFGRQRLLVRLARGLIPAMMGTLHTWIFIPLFACEVFDGDLAPVRPNQKQLLSIADLALRQDGDSIPRDNGYLGPLVQMY
jgi:hypothetical protein